VLEELNKAVGSEQLREVGELGGLKGFVGE